VLHITTDASAGMELARSSEKKKQSLKQHLLEKMKTWINSLLEGERDEFLGRDRQVWLDESHARGQECPPHGLCRIQC
jgi:hypothetical protein